MQRSQTIILSLILLFNYTLSNTCSNYFESEMKSKCESLSINSTHSCVYSKGKCDTAFKSCSSYTGKDSKICSSIILSNIYKKCEIKENVCTEVVKTCEEYDSSLSMTCTSLSAGDNQRCILNGNKCEAHYKYCDDFTTGVNEVKCKANIPSDKNNKCIWDNNACTEVKKECKDYASTTGSFCIYLSTSSDDKVCVPTTNGYCKEQYKTCELYNTKETSKSQTGCEEIYPYYGSDFSKYERCEYIASSKTCLTRETECKDMTGESAEYLCLHYFTPLDKNKRCVYVDSQCKEQYKTCELYNSNVNAADKTAADCEAIQIDDSSSKCVYDKTTKTCSTKKIVCSDFTTQSDCISFRPEDTNKKCAFINNKCEEQYKTCEIYNEQSTKDADTCNKIQPYETDYDNLDIYSKCVYEDSQCKRVPKPCNELTESYYCSYHEVDDDHICIYEDNQCKQVYKSCSNYNNKETNKKEEDCKKVRDFYLYSYYGHNYGYINYNYKCVYEDGTCKKQELTKCEDYEPGLDKEYCNHIFPNGYKKCDFNNNKCEAKYTDCPGSSEVLSKEECESITPTSSYYRCTLNTNNNCVQVRKNCEEYNGTSSDSCYNYYAAEDENKKCVMEEDKCVEKYATCSSYTGNDENTCKSIIPYDSSGDSLGKYQKCVYERNACVMKKRNCSEMETESRCEKLTPNDSNKKCVYINNACTEQYKDCDAYSNNKNGDEVVKTTCESIILTDTSYKCVYYPDATKKCIKE